MWQPIIEVSTCPIEWRIHGLIGDGSDAPNVVQAYAERSILQTATGYFASEERGSIEPIPLFPLPMNRRCGR